MNSKLRCLCVLTMAVVICAAGWAQTRFVDFKLRDLDGKVHDTRTLREGKALVLKLGATWCRYCRLELKELDKLRKDFAPADLAIVDVYIEESPDTVASHAGNLPFTVLLDEKGAVGRSLGVKGIPVVMVIDTEGKVSYRGNYTPHAVLRKRVKRVLAERGTALAKESTAGIAQTVCPVMGGTIDKTVFADHKGKRIYFCCAGCDTKFKSDPDRYMKKLAAAGVTPEHVYAICTSCGEIKSSDACCAAGKPKCDKCGLIKGSTGCERR